MVHSKNDVAGWLDTSIHDFLGAFPSSFANMKYALVSCIDSNRNVHSLLPKSPELKYLATGRVARQRATCAYTASPGSRCEPSTFFWFRRGSVLSD